MFENTPNHEQKGYANKTLHWFSSDSENAYNENLKSNLEMLVKNNWTSDDALTRVSYKFNANGFRSREIDVNNPGIAVFGCSFTTGVGLPAHELYHYYIGKELNLPVDNFGVQGASNGVAFRLAQHWLPILKPKIVILQTTFADRLEIINKDNQSVVVTPMAVSLHNRVSYHSLYQQWCLNDANGIIDKQKSELAIRYLCHSLNIPVFVVDVSDFTISSLGPLHQFGRDLMHPGVTINRYIGLNLIEKILEHTTLKDLNG